MLRRQCQIIAVCLCVGIVLFERCEVADNSKHDHSSLPYHHLSRSSSPGLTLLIVIIIGLCHSKYSN